MKKIQSSNPAPPFTCSPGNALSSSQGLYGCFQAKDFVPRVPTCLLPRSCMLGGPIEDISQSPFPFVVGSELDWGKKERVSSHVATIPGRFSGL